MTTLRDQLNSVEMANRALVLLVSDFLARILIPFPTIAVDKYLGIEGLISFVLWLDIIILAFI